MLRNLSDDLEEGEICDDEEIDIKQSSIAKYSSIAINERTNLTRNCVQSLYHANCGSLHSNSNLEIPYQSVVSPKINGDNLQRSNNEEGENEAEKDKSEDFHGYEVSEENEEECFLDHRMMDEDESENELKASNFQDELVEYQSNLDDESDDDDNDNSGFSDEIVCSEGIIAANEFRCKMAALAVNAEDRTNRNATADEDEMRTTFVEEVPVDDSWIFHSLDEPSRIVVQGDETMDSCMLPESEGNLKEQLAEMDLSKFEVMIDVTVSGCLDCGDTEAVDVVKDEKQMLCEESNNQAKQIVELGKKFAEEKENYVRNMYSLLVTARTQIAALKKENEKLKMRLQGNCTMNCPKCKHQLCLRNNSLKPKYIKVLKGRCAIEMLFDNLGKMEEWLAANHLDINPDGLPVVLELPRKRTLASTNSLLAPKLNSVRDIRRNTDKVAPISSSIFRNSGITCPVERRKNRQPVGTIENFNRHSTKQHEILNPVTQSEKAQEKFSSSIACNSSDKRERRSYDRKRSEPDKYEEQQRHRFLSTYTSPDRSFDHDPRRRFNSSRSRSFHGSRQNMKFNAAKRMMSVSNRKATDQEDLHLAIDSFRDRFEYQSSSPEHRRQSIRLPMCNRPTEESSYRDLWNRFKTGSNKKKHGTKTVTGLIAGRDR